MIFHEINHHIECHRCGTPKKGYPLGVVSEFLTVDDDVITVVECGECKNILRVISIEILSPPKCGAV